MPKVRALLSTLLVAACSGASSSPETPTRDAEPVVGAADEEPAVAERTPETKMATKATEATEATECGAGPTMEVVRDPGVTTNNNPPDGVAPWPIEGVVLQVDARWAEGRVIATATIRNDTRAPQAIDYLTGGTAGTSTNPFIIAVEGASSPKPEGPRPPEVFPSRQRETLPPGAAIHFKVSTCGPQSARATWTFGIWGQSQHGTIDIAP